MQAEVSQSCERLGSWSNGCLRWKSIGCWAMNGDGLFKRGIIENEGRQYKSRTTYGESCWGKCMRMSAAGLRARTREKKITTREEVVPGRMCPITAFELRFSALSEPLFARPALTRSQATASNRRCVSFCSDTARVSHYTLHDRTTIYSTIHRALFHLNFKGVMRSRCARRGKFDPKELRQH